MSPREQPIVAVVEAPGERGWPGLEPLDAQAEVRRVSSAATDALIEALRDADVLVVTDFRADSLRRAFSEAKRLEWVHATSAGVDMLLFPELIESDVPVTNARGIFDRPIAEYVLGCMLLFAKDLLTSVELQRAHRWKHRDNERIQGRRVLVVGAGSIGRQIAQLARAVGMHVEGVASRRRDADPDFDAVYASADLDARLEHADFVAIAAPLTDATRGLFGAEQFRRMRRDARLINIGRGPIVQTDALTQALREGDIAGAALDVLEQEPLPADHPLWDMPQVVISPHMAGDVVGWRHALSEQFLDNFRRWREGRPLENLVDKKRGYVPPNR